jgi:hypothetical protein
MMNSRFTGLLVILAFAVSPVPAQVVSLSGIVRDAVTNEPLPAANIRVEGTSKGTVANALGVYKLSLDQGRYSIIYSFIGYRSDTLRITLNHATEFNPRLQPSAVQMSEVLVTSEDPAMAIMRKVIENKKRWLETLKSYEFDAFTRVVMRRDTAIAMITESYTTGYWQKGDTLREIVKQKRQTENIRGIGNVAVGGSVINFYQDDVNFSGFHFVGPTSVEAFDYYDFKLEKTRQRDGIPVYVIRVIPKSRITPLFSGKLDVIGDTYALIGVDVVPNEVFSIPFISKLDIHYTQQFGMYENQYWMPMDVRLTGLITIDILGFSIPRIGLEQASVLYDYKINRQLPDTVFKKRRITELEGAKKFDSTFWAQHDVLPLTHEEQTAYRSLDSTQTLDKQFQPKGPLSDLPSSLEFLRYAKVHYNRVEGAFLGANLSRDSVTNHLALFGWGGYGFADKKWRFGVGGTAYLDSARRFSATLERHRIVDNIPDEEYYHPIVISVAALLSKRDYRDYYYANGWSVTLEAKPLRRLTLDLQYQNEDELTAITRTDYSVFDRRIPFRPNPAIDDGTMRSLKLKTRFGDDPVPFGLISRDYAEVEVEHSDRNFMASAFDFTRVLLRGEARITTYASRLLFPPVLNMKLTAGTSMGSLPTQRLFSLESGYDGIGPFGVLRAAGTKEFSGHQFVSFSIEHNFRSTPFLILNIPYLYRNSIELIVHGTAAKTWGSTPLPFGRVTDGWYSEAGIGISRIFTFFRLDFTYRFAEPRAAYVTVGVAQIL